MICNEEVVIAVKLCEKKPTSLKINQNTGEHVGKFTNLGLSLV
jgi:hypothetical protein